MSKDRQWVLCRTGTFGQDGATITEKDIDELVETFPGRRPPIAIGHNMAYDDKMPQFGAVLDVWKKKTRGAVQLIGDVKLIEAMDPVFDQGAYQGWSVSIPREAATGKRYLHHLALCGSVPPKIPGLKEIGISYGDKEEKEIFSFTDKIEFQEDSMTDEDKKKMEELEKKNEALQKEMEDLKKNPGQDKKDFSELEKKYEDLNKKYAAQEAENRKNRVSSFLKAVAEKVPAGVKAKVQALADQLVGVPEFCFTTFRNQQVVKDKNNGFASMYKIDSDRILTGYTEHKIKEEMLGWGEGARAEIYLFNGYSSFGHLIMAEVSIGHVVYIDPQLGKLTNGKIFNKAWTDMTKFFRTDDLQFNENVIKCVKNRKNNDKRRSS